MFNVAMCRVIISISYIMFLYRFIRISWCWIFQVRALHYLHSNRIIHRDMKPQNILIGAGSIVKVEWLDNMRMFHCCICNPSSFISLTFPLLDKRFSCLWLSLLIPCTSCWLLTVCMNMMNWWARLSFLFLIEVIDTYFNPLNI